MPAPLLEGSQGWSLLPCSWRLQRLSPGWGHLRWVPLGEVGPGYPDIQLARGRQEMKDRAQLAESWRAKGTVSWKCSNTSGKLGPSAANGQQLRGRLQLPGRKLRLWQAGRLPAWRPPSVLPQRAAARGAGPGSASASGGRSGQVPRC